MHLLNRLITKIKGEKFEIDSCIPISYIFLFLLTKFISLLYGMYRLRTTKRIFIHPSAIVKCSTKLEVGKNFSIAKNCYIDALSKNGIVLGANVSIGKYTTIECTGSLKNVGTGLMIGNNVGLGTHGFWGCAGGISVGNDCIFGNFVSLHSENHNYVDINIPIRLQGVNRKGIIIGNNCWIGAKVTILDGSIIGDGCVIAAGTVVRGTFPNNCIIGGVPSKILKYRTT